MIQGNSTNRPHSWEDEPPAETRARRTQQVNPRVGRPLPGVVADASDADADEAVHPSWGASVSGLTDGPSRPWWRPEGSFGRALLVLGALAVVGGLAVAVLFTRSSLERDARFRIAGTANIQATGLTEVSRADMLPVFGEDIGKNIFFVHLDERRHQLEAIPWVQHATVMRVLPDRIRVSVVERIPVAFTQIGDQTGLVDADGVLLTMSASTMAERHYSFPEVTGLKAADTPDSRKTRMNVYMRMMDELDAGGQHNSQQISEVDLSDLRDAQVKMADQGGDIVAHFGEDRFLGRYQRYMKHIAEWRQQYPHLTSIDLRYEGQVLLKMNPADAGQPADAPNTAQAGAEPPPAAPSHAVELSAKPSAKPSAISSRQPLQSVAKPKAGTPGSAHTERSQTEKAKAGKSKAERLRTERAKAEKQHRRDVARRATLTAAQHQSAPTTHPVSAAVEGQ
jgi:cell division protein FtsQ